MTSRSNHLIQHLTAECARMEQERIGDTVNVWPLRGEDFKAFSFRVQLAITEEILAREELLDRALSLSHRTSTRNADE